MLWCSCSTRLFEPRAKVSKSVPILLKFSVKEASLTCPFSNFVESNCTPSCRVTASTAKVLKDACAPVGMPRAHRHAKRKAPRKSATYFFIFAFFLDPKNIAPTVSAADDKNLAFTVCKSSLKTAPASPLLAIRPSRACFSIGFKRSRSKPTLPCGNARFDSKTALASKSKLGSAPSLPSGDIFMVSTRAPAGRKYTYAC
mmetsp:Transcript_6046/g.22854  ORF Transcript_6046/g.22854 Transcript_6046/m.22854 type:complete len:200 (+) Transcript_6046:995-1594(+)